METLRTKHSNSGVSYLSRKIGIVDRITNRILSPSYFVTYYSLTLKRRNPRVSTGRVRSGTWSLPKDFLRRTHGSLPLRSVDKIEEGRYVSNRGSPGVLNDPEEGSYNTTMVV